MANPNDTTNYIEQMITNIQTVIGGYQSYLGYKAIYDTDDAFISMYPAITIELDNVTEAWKQMARIKTITATFNVTYYMANYDNNVLRKDIRAGLNKLCNIFRENWDLNNYCNDLGASVVSATPYIIARGEAIIAGGVVVLEVRKVVTVTLV